jgi:hypothetical protein
VKNLYKPHYHNIWRDDYMDGLRRTHNLLGTTAFVTNTFTGDDKKYYSGLYASEVQRVTLKEVPVYKLQVAPACGPDEVTNNTLCVYRPPITKPVTQGVADLMPLDFMHAPMPIGAPEEISKTADKIRPYKMTLEGHDRYWDLPAFHDSPPYFNYDRRHFY